LRLSHHQQSLRARKRKLNQLSQLIQRVHPNQEEALREEDPVGVQVDPVVRRSNVLLTPKQVIDVNVRQPTATEDAISINKHQIYFFIPIRNFIFTI
jgi:hypothetical protein